MPEGLTEEEIIEILETYERNDEKKKPTAEELDYSRKTVRKYVNEHYEDYKDSAGGDIGEESADGGEAEPSPPERNGDDTPDEFTAKPPSQDPLRPEAQQTPDEKVSQDDLESMSPGEFIDWFFSHQGHGVKEDFKARVVDMCEMRNEIPDREWLQNKILTAASGIGNEGDAEMIAETYWVTAQNYMRSKGKPDYAYDGMGGGAWHDPDSQRSAQREQNTGGDSQGEWVGAGTDGPQRGPSTAQNGRGDSGGWESPPSQSSRMSPNGHQPDRRQGMRQERPGFIGERGARQDDGPSEEVQKLAEIVREQQNDIDKIVNAMQNDRSPSEQANTLAEQARELRQAKEEMEALTEDSSSDELQEVVNHFQSQISDLERKLATEQAGEGAGGGGSGGELQVMMQLAQRDDMDTDTLKMFSEAMGTTDPEVKKAEFDLKKTEKKAEARRETIDALFENVGDVAEKASGSLVESFLSGGGGDEQAPPPAENPPAGHQPPQRETQRAEPQPSSTRERFEELDAGADEGDIDLADSAERAVEEDEEQ